MGFIYCEHPILLKNPEPLKAIKQPAFYVPCGECILCRYKARKEWTLRLRLEAFMYEESLFVTLTYDQEHVPQEVCVRDIQLFMKRLRKNSKLKFRFYSVSEYGSHTERPHFHVILFGFPLSMQEYIKKSWTLGFVTIAPLTADRCNYACGYTQKKYDKKSDKSLYSLFPHLTYDERLNLYLNCSDILKKTYHKDIDPRRAEFATCSLGIGKSYLLKYWKKIREEYCIHFGGKKYSIPRYFRKVIATFEPEWIDEWKKHQEQYAEERLGGLYVKVDETYVDVPIDLGDGLVVSLNDKEGYAKDKFRDFVDFKAQNFKRKRELFKNSKNKFKEI